MPLPARVRGLAEAFAGAGFAVEPPRLPGHGTTVADMATTTFSDWQAEVEQDRDNRNNLGAAFVSVKGKPRVMLVQGDVGKRELGVSLAK